MQSVQIPIHDCVRINAPDRLRAAENILDYARTRGAFNYQGCRGSVKEAFPRKLPLEVAVQGCFHKGSPIGFEHNAEAFRTVWPWIERHNARTHLLSEKFYPISADLCVPVKLDFFFVHQGVPNVVWLQPRKRFIPSSSGLQIVGHVISSVAADEFRDFEISLVSAGASPETSSRRLEVLTRSDFVPISTQELKDFFGFFADAFRLVQAEYAAEKARRTRPDKDAEPFI